jgi:poly-D-alanine transfer protein DltD
VDIWTKNGRDDAYVKKIRQQMKQGGFRRIIGDKYLEPDSGLYHSVINFSIEYETEDE